MVKSWKTIGVCALCICGATSAIAEMFCWKPGSNSVFSAWQNFSNPENWVIPNPNGENPQGLVPGANDSIYGARNAYWNLEGKTWTVKNWSSQTDWTKYNSYLSNGTIVVTGECRTRRYQIVLRRHSVLSFPVGSLLNGGEGDAGSSNHYMQIDDGSLLDIRGTLQPYNYYLGIQPGGTAIIDPEDFHLSPTTKQAGNTIYIQGKAIFPNGLVWTGDAGGSDARFYILLRGGTIVASGDFSRNDMIGKFEVVLEDLPKGGAFEATGDVTFSCVDKAVVKYGMSFLVHDGATLDMTPFVFEATTTPCYKLGKGVLRLGASLPAGLIITDGTVALSSRFDSLPGFSFLNKDAKLRVEAAGSRLDSIDAPAQTANLSFECGFDLSDVELETPFFSSADSEILLRAKAGFMEACPDSRRVSIVDGSLVLVNSGFRMLFR